MTEEKKEEQAAQEEAKEEQAAPEAKEEKPEADEAVAAAFPLQMTFLLVFLLSSYIYLFGRIFGSPLIPSGRIRFS